MVKPREAWDGFFVQVVHCFSVKYNDNIANRKKKGKNKREEKTTKKNYVIFSNATMYYIFQYALTI